MTGDKNESSRPAKIYYHILCPFSRTIRIALNEQSYNLNVQYVIEKFWEWNEDFLIINPAGQLPVIISNDGAVIKGLYASIEYIEYLNLNKSLINGSIVQKSEIRSLIDWFSSKMYQEVTKHLLQEKAIKVITKNGYTNSNVIRAAKKNLLYHLDYISYLLECNNYLQGDTISMADCAAAAQISLLDYLGDMPWDYSPKVKHWYSLMKSRPSMQEVLSEGVSGIVPPSHYKNPDF